LRTYKPEKGDAGRISHAVVTFFIVSKKFQTGKMFAMNFHSRIRSLSVGGNMAIPGRQKTKAEHFMKRASSANFHATLLLICALALPLLSLAQVQPRLQAAIFIKLLNYDAALAKKTGSTVMFHIILDGKTQASESVLETEFSVISQQKIAGKSVQMVTTQLKMLDASTSSDAAHVYYLPDGSARTTLDTVLKKAIATKIPVLSGNAELVQSGAAVGITVANGKPQIIVNLKQSRAMGMNLSSQLLKLAKII
jgi:hypothetical protein